MQKDPQEMICRICARVYSDRDYFFQHYYAVHKTVKVVRNSAFPFEQIREDLKNHYSIKASDFDPSFDHHYENEPVSTEQRGGEMFFTPSFCTKIALNVKTRVPCDSWLDKKCGWPVVYHGTSADNAGSIIRNGLFINGGQVSPTHGAVHGPGVYVSPKHEVILDSHFRLEQPCQLPQLCPHLTRSLSIF
jgi:hypothetical protein